MQWHLQRILAMSGAAGWREKNFEHGVLSAPIDALPSVEQWLDDQPGYLDQSRWSSPSELVEMVDDLYD
jgi:hypothetical protein